MHGGGGVSDDFPLAALWAGARTLRFADGPDEVHREQIAKLELSRYRPKTDAIRRTMSNAHFKFWPTQAMHNLIAPATNLFYNAEVSARRYPQQAIPGLLRHAGELRGISRRSATRRGISASSAAASHKGDRVLLLMQNSPQFMIGYYGILRANAVVVPLNPMNLTQEILRYAQDAGATTLLVSQELYPRVEPLLKSGELKHVIVAAYSDYLKEPTSLTVPEFIAAPRVDYQGAGT